MIISAKHADISNSDNIVIYDLNMTIDEGDFVYITGKVGTGKSSIFRAFTAQTKPVSGELIVNGYNLNKLKSRDIPKLRRSIGVVFQDLQLLNDRNVHDNLSFVLRATGWKKEAEIEKRINDVLNMVGVSTKSHKYPYQLSGGEQQRVCIERSILNEPKIILADEPTASLDKDTAESIMILFDKLNKELNTAIIIITHDNDIIRRHPGKIYHCENESCILKDA